jgi:hypothetical protein
MATRGRGARLKGANFEREMANFLTEETGLAFLRGLLQVRGGGKEEADVYCKDLADMHFELKRQKSCNIKAAMEQATDDAPTKLRVVVTKDDRKDILVTMCMDDFLKIFKIYLANK